ncbi:hypothetical protein [Filimonas effusa]|uniref:DUF1735 domain-containing protein n=1 Tax=Filimonas effusa TaxID=2508721 RepID=A0A4Q1DCT9_9BACT|nr:hypothetical protein [Filimonas effusa]RXK86788.1 hypothetical protein ESB13_08315 [Filimonas effusa]
MKSLYQYAILLIAAAVLFSCSKNSGGPETGTPDEEAGSYQLEEITYSLASGDGIDTVKLNLAGGEFSNYGNNISEQKMSPDYSSLTKRSLFTLSNGETAPKGLLLDTVKVPVPSNWYSNQGYSVDTRLFTLSGKEVELPYLIADSHDLNVSVPARSRVVIDSKIDRYTIRCSFKAIFKNAATGARDTITGKWNGTLRYNNSSFVATEYPL